MERLHDSLNGPVDAIHKLAFPLCHGCSRLHRLDTGKASRQPAATVLVSLYFTRRSDRDHRVRYSTGVLCGRSGRSNRDFYGVEILNAEIENLLIGEGASSTAKLLLEGLAVQVLDRRKRMFVACFCSNGMSPFRWRKFGRYCLRFDTDVDRQPLVRPATGFAEVEQHRVIYGRARQRHAIQ